MSQRENSFESLRPLVSSTDIEDEDLARGALLLAKVGAFPRSEHRKRRVWNALRLGSRPPLSIRLRTWHLAVAGVLITAASSAAVGGLYVARSRAPQRELAAMPVPPAKPSKPARPVTHVAAPAAPAPESVSAPERERTPPAPLPARPRASDASPHVKAAQSEAEAELLVEAMRARREGDARRVSQLVDEYRAKHPNGALQEEALILSVESAVARHSPQAPALAREYLSRFPNGRFAAQAKRAAASGAR